ncbi:GLUG motif-containing protein, partial [Sedimentisphaera salicampi]|uniref:GLUG motif-containing protein n=1 Tax=Sedimentisphaera salicampi TaxID=1941349 RepID=UPI00195836C9
MCTLRVSLLAAVAAAGIAFGFAAGDGTENNPYQISTPDHLEAVNNDLSAHYILINDIDLAGITYNKAVIAPYTDSNSPEFSGRFDGSGFEIKNLTINGGENSYVGLFGRSALGFVENTGITNCNIIGQNCVAGLIGSSHNSIISNCYTVGSLEGIEQLGLLSGYMRIGIAKNSYTMGSIIGLDGAYRVGGLSGMIHNATIMSCYSSASIEADLNSWGVGGLCGYNYFGSILNSYSTGSVRGHESTGGLCGRNYDGAISNCYSTGFVQGDIKVGGMCGSEANAGGPVSNSFWNIETSDTNISSGGTGLTSLQMQDIDTYIDSGWDFVDEYANGTSQIWVMSETTGYPELASIRGYSKLQLIGEGTIESPYLIDSSYQLGAVYEYNPKSNYKLTSNIDLSDIQWSTPVIPFLDGHFDGNGFLINNLSIVGGSNIGFIGRIGENGFVNNVQIINTSISGYANVGGVCGLNGHFYDNGGVIKGCGVNIVIDGTRQIGGIAGANFRGNIEECFSVGNVSALDYNAGGLAGRNGGIVANCYSLAKVSSKRSIGGLVGHNEDGKIINSYSNEKVTGNSETGGLVGSVSVDGYYEDIGNFWDTQTSEQPSSVMGTGKMTSEMQDINTFLSAGWDFAGEEINGTGNIWDISDNYPYLNWQPVHTVMFLSGINGSIISGETEQSLPLGWNPNPPNILPESGWLFTGWDADFSVIKSDLTVTAQYGEALTITFNPGEHGSIEEGDSVQVIAKGNDAAAPLISAFAGYFFIGWDTDLYNVTEDITVTALYGVLNGDGTENNPYQISTPDHLEAVNNDLSAHYVLTNDIDLSGRTYDRAVIAPDTNNNQVWQQGPKFNGILNGNGHSIIGLTIKSDTHDYLALIGKVDDGEVRNLTVENADIESSRSGFICVGSVAGVNCGIIENVECSGNLTSTSSGKRIGGLCGFNNGGRITNCYADCSVSGNFSIGGLCGGNETQGEIYSCHSSGTVSGGNEAEQLGGLCGYNNSTIADSLTDCSVSGGNSSYDLGGLCGRNGSGSITNCYAEGSVSFGDDSWRIGGFCGRNEADLSSCHSSGTVSG